MEEVFGFDMAKFAKPRVHVPFCPLSENCQLENELVSVDYTSKVGEKQFSDVWKRHKSRESKIKFCCSWFAGPTRSPYFAGPSLHVQSASWNSTPSYRRLEDEEQNCK